MNKNKRKVTSRKHKNLMHLAIVGGIVISLFHEGGGIADWLFVALSVIVEVD